jgi:hypothetical protein
MNQSRSSFLLDGFALERFHRLLVMKENQFNMSVANIVSGYIRIEVVITSMTALACQEAS